MPGDVIRVRLGDIVRADARLLEGDPIEVDQSALTGESLPATRKPGEAVFSGSIIRQGEIGGLVYPTGQNTYFGKTAQLVQEAHASARLNAMNLRFKTRMPWALTFSFSRAIQQPALEIWKGQQANATAAQKALYHRARCNSAARLGQYRSEMENNVDSRAR